MGYFCGYFSILLNFWVIETKCCGCVHVYWGQICQQYNPGPSSVHGVLHLGNNSENNQKITWNNSNNTLIRSGYHLWVIIDEFFIPSFKPKKFGSLGLEPILSYVSYTASWKETQNINEVQTLWMSDTSWVLIWPLFQGLFSIVLAAKRLFTG